MSRKVLVLVALLVVSVIVDVLAGAEQPGFGAAIGLVGTFLLTFGSKALANLIKRDTDHYDHGDLPRPQPAEPEEGTR